MPPGSVVARQMKQTLNLGDGLVQIINPEAATDRTFRHAVGQQQQASGTIAVDLGHHLRQRGFLEPQDALTPVRFLLRIDAAQRRRALAVISAIAASRARFG